MNSPSMRTVRGEVMVWPLKARTFFRIVFPGGGELALCALRAESTDGLDGDRFHGKGMKKTGCGIPARRARATKAPCCRG